MTTTTPERHCRRFGARGHQWAPAFATDARFERCACGAARHVDALNDNPSIRLWERGPADTTCASCIDLVYHRPTTRPPRWMMESDAWDDEPYPQRGDFWECRKRRLLTNENARQQPSWAACRWWYPRGRRVGDDWDGG